MYSNFAVPVQSAWLHLEEQQPSDSEGAQGPSTNAPNPLWLSRLDQVRFGGTHPGKGSQLPEENKPTFRPPSLQAAMSRPKVRGPPEGGSKAVESREAGERNNSLLPSVGHRPM